MPHVIVEQSANIKKLNAIDLLTKINQTLFATGSIAQRNDIKARLRVDQDFVIGAGHNNQAYIHVKIYLLSGRTLEQKQQISHDVLDVLQQFEDFDANQLEVQLCVEIIEMDRTVYQKQLKAF
ncbi:5-carboxymethyl-2-hydroxymuconate Delta-isomerase [Acinetobacter puyangensis]|uniref:5-carboxymethyl-2-hydroxymuconate isomerase n=1 Tax=Acinetobacter puyangensis TaxID=1096779 RepID=A0A240EAY2_9GAMM|nr:5-carboxymethyl-2-hydroxymuconate Delta-isomerase [Acinetobacter puyangensis]SNX45867.1 5-carboxymethyl-2-hydroxymuconate isomerase [Acinetobacter puyangensis]